MPDLRKWIILALIAGFSGYAAAEDATSPTIGTVVSTEDSGSYTYVQLAIEGSNVWYAVPASEFKAGEKVVAPPGLPMKNFYSKTLDRTFETVYFADGINTIGAESTTGNLPAGHPPVQATLPPGHPSIQTTLPPGHPPVCTSTNSACCPLQNATNACCGSTNSAAP